MLLVVDIGNSNTVVGVFEGSELRHSWRLSTRREQTADEWVVFFRNLFEQAAVDPAGIDSILISSVVPPLNDSFEQMATRLFPVPARFVDPDEGVMPVLYSPPSDVGADRIVNSLAALERYGAPVIVVDFGTATTFDVVSADGEYLGGTIAPGIRVSAEALFSRTARLPRIEIRRPHHIVGRSTVESIQAGLFFGYVGLVDGILTRLKRDFDDAPVVATGGLAHLIATEAAGIDSVDDDLTLEGLRLYWERVYSS